MLFSAQISLIPSYGSYSLRIRAHDRLHFLDNRNIHYHLFFLLYITFNLLIFSIFHSNLKFLRKYSQDLTLKMKIVGNLLILQYFACIILFEMFSNMTWNWIQLFALFSCAISCFNMSHFFIRKCSHYFLVSYSFILYH